jgi:hypothetical protein
VKTAPSSAKTSAMPGAADQPLKMRRRQTTSARSTGESNQRPRRAVAIVIALPLRIQPGIHSIEDSSPKWPVDRIMQLQKLRSPPDLTVVS